MKLTPQNPVIAQGTEQLLGPTPTIVDSGLRLFKENIGDS